MQTLAEWLANSWWMLVAAGLGTLGLWLMSRGLIADRAKGRRRCPKCWYELQAAAMPVQCTECGRIAKSERELGRTHRRWGVAVAGVALIAISPWTKRFPDAVRNGPARLVPTWALLQFCGDEQVRQWTEETLLFGAKATSPYAQELVRRGVEEAIPMWQSEMFERRVRRYLVSKGEAVMPSGEEEILRRLDAAKLPSDRAIAEMEELFAEVGKALGTRVEVDWESMWEGRVLKTDKVGLDTRGLPARVALDRVLAARPTPAWLKWSAVGGGIKCELGTGARPREVRGFEVGSILNAKMARDWELWDWTRKHRILPSVSPIRDNFPGMPRLRSEVTHEFQQTVTRFVLPAEWIDNGGESSVSAWLGDRMLVLSPPSVHAEADRLFRKMAHPCVTIADVRRDEGVRAAFELEDWTNATWLGVEDPPKSMVEWQEFFRSKLPCPLVVSDLGRYVWLPEPVHLPPQGESTLVSELLDRVWIQARNYPSDEDWQREFSWRIDCGRIVVVDDQRDIEPYVVVAHDIADFLDFDEHFQDSRKPDYEIADDLRKVISNIVSPNTWADNGGDQGSMVEFGTLLIVSQSERNQIAVAKLLDELRAKRKALPNEGRGIRDSSTP